MKINSRYSWDWPIAVLAVVLIYSAAARLSVTNWTPDLWTIEAIAFLGTLLGLGLGISKFQKAPLRWLITSYSLVVIPWILTRQIEGETTIVGQLASLAGRFGAANAALWRGEPVTDSLHFVTLMCILFWFIGLISGYQVMRHSNALATVIPPMIPLLVVQYYDSYEGRRIWMVGFFFLIVMLIIGRLNLVKNRGRWKKERILAGTEPEFDITRGLLLAALLVIFVSWGTPTPAAAIPAVARFWNDLSKPFDRTRERFDDMLASLKGGVSLVPGELYGSTMSLGQSAQQGDTEIFRAKPSEFTGTRHYWRVRVYDRYQNGNWSTAGSQNVFFSPDEDGPINIELFQDETVNFVFNWKSNGSSILITPSYPLWLSRTGTFQINPLREDAYDVLSWTVSPPVLAGDQYQVQAVLFNPTIKQLRAAPENYPDWIKVRYLALPEKLSGDIRRLAERLTRDYDNSYDKANAITNYLRTEMEYNLEITPPPLGVDPVDWFLFTWKSGFCNYYASAEVLLLRAAGIPARMVVGYAPGTYQTDGSYLVSAKDAHAWPEVYFSEIGWVEFEPTVSQDVIFRPSGEDRVQSENDDLMWRQQRLERFGLEEGLLPDDVQRPAPIDPESNATVVSPLLSRWLWVIILTVVVFGAAVALWRVERQRAVLQKIPRTIKNFYIRYHLNTPKWLDDWVRWSEVTAVERAFHAINQALSWLGKPQPQDMTALERAELLKKLVPVSTEAIDTLVAAHEKTLYTPQPANPAAAIRAAWTIRYQTLRALIGRRIYLDD